MSDDEYVNRVIDIVRKSPGKFKSARAIADVTRGKRNKIVDAIKDARAIGLLTVTPDGSFCVSEKHL